MKFRWFYTRAWITWTVALYFVRMHKRTAELLGDGISLSEDLFAMLRVSLEAGLEGRGLHEFIAVPDLAKVDPLIVLASPGHGNAVGCPPESPQPGESKSGRSGACAASSARTGTRSRRGYRSRRTELLDPFRIRADHSGEFGQHRLAGGHVTYFALAHDFNCGAARDRAADLSQKFFDRLKCRKQLLLVCDVQFSHVQYFTPWR